jgi:nucleoside-diphosphate-sugar epimerase
MPRALILGGTGAIGRATALRLLQDGWDVDLTGRTPRRFDNVVAAEGGRYIQSERRDSKQLSSAFGNGVDLLVDCVCFTSLDAEQLVPFAKSAASTVMISSKAVYVDSLGHHSNSDVAPDFGGPIRESQPTMAPGDGDFTTREGYGANKVAAEMVLLDSGLPVSILRPSKIHGVGARRPREWYFVKRVLDRRPVALFARAGESVDHTTAATNLAALIQVVAREPGQRILNSADPDAPTVVEIARSITSHLNYTWEEVMLGGEAPAELGRSPWGATYPIILDTSASADLGYVPVGNFAATVRAEIAWLVGVASGETLAQLPGDFDTEFFDGLFDYNAEDEYRRASPRAGQSG